MENAGNKCISKILSDFAKYINGNKNFEILYSPKIGYIHFGLSRGEIVTIDKLKNAGELLNKLFGEIVDDVRDLKLEGEHFDFVLSPVEQREARRYAAEIMPPQYLVLFEQYLDRET